MLQGWSAATATSWAIPTGCRAPTAASTTRSISRSHNSYLIQQLEMVHRTMALVATTSLAAEGRGGQAIEEHEVIVRAIEARDGAAAEAAIRDHISAAFETRLRTDAERSGL